MKFVLVSIATLWFVSACGGSSSNMPRQPTPVDDPIDLQAKISNDTFNVYYPDTILEGQSVGVAVAAKQNKRLTQIKWSQIAGPSLTMLATNSQVVGFDIQEVGEYRLLFEAINQANASISQEIAFTAGASNASQANIRLDHSAVETSKVSLRIDDDNVKTVQSISWEQTAGSVSSALTEEDAYLFFDAPSVTKDTVLELSATIRYSDGSSASDSAYVLIKDTDINNDGYFPKFAEQVVTTDVYAYRPLGEHAAQLVNCAYNNQIAQSCPFSRLPLLGQQYENPSIDNVMDRLIVSHDWMGKRFEQFLQQSQVSEDMLNLLRATTAIVISYDVRPSFYWTATGAIYLDAANFWLTPQERDTLNDQPDYRSDFGNDLSFIIPWRYVKNNDYYFRSSDFPVAARLSKSFADLEARAAWLMYHELGHANDFFPPNSWSTLDTRTSPLSYANNNDASSEAFSSIFPLGSVEMSGLAQVSFAGQSATNTQKSYVASDVTSFFEPDRAPAYYSYSTIREDYATLFERFMMAYRLGVSADVAVISTDDNDELIVDWGQRDRINSQTIQARVKHVVERILPALPVSEIQADLPEPQLMIPGVDWFTNLELGGGTAQSRTAKKAKNLKPSDTKDYWQVYRHGPSNIQR